MREKDDEHICGHSSLISFFPPLKSLFFSFFAAVRGPRFPHTHTCKKKKKEKETRRRNFANHALACRDGGAIWSDPPSTSIVSIGSLFFICSHTFFFFSRFTQNVGNDIAKKVDLFSLTSLSVLSNYIIFFTSGSLKRNESDNSVARSENIRQRGHHV